MGFGALEVANRAGHSPEGSGDSGCAFGGVLQFGVWGGRLEEARVEQSWLDLVWEDERVELSRN